MSDILDIPPATIFTGGKREHFHFLGEEKPISENPYRKKTRFFAFALGTIKKTAREFSM